MNSIFDFRSKADARAFRRGMIRYGYFARLITLRKGWMVCIDKGAAK